MSIVIKMEEITPAKATRWLKQNTGNFRNLSTRVVDLYTEDLVAGCWDENGETIKFNGKLLLDGQHRLAAIVESGVTVRMAVARGIKATAVRIDRGKPRSIGQWLAHLGYRNVNILAAVARFCILHDRGLWCKMSTDGITDTEIIDFVKMHLKKLEECIFAAVSCQGVVRSKTVIATIVFLGSPGDHASDLGIWFCDKLNTGAELESNEPVLLLRNKLMASKESHHNRMSRILSLATITVAWNKTVAGEVCNKAGLRVILSGPTKTKLPTEVSVSNE